MLNDESTKMSAEVIANIIFPETNTVDQLDDAFKALEALNAGWFRQVVDALEKKAIKLARIQPTIQWYQGVLDRVCKELGTPNEHQPSTEHMMNSAFAKDLEPTQTLCELFLRIAHIKGDAAEPLTKTTAREITNLSREDYGSYYNLMIAFEKAQQQESAPEFGAQYRQPLMTITDINFSGKNAQQIVDSLPAPLSARQVDYMFELLKPLAAEDADKYKQVVDIIEKTSVEELKSLAPYLTQRREIHQDVGEIIHGPRTDEEVAASMDDARDDMRKDAIQAQISRQFFLNLAEIKGDAAGSMTKAVAKEVATLSSKEANSLYRLSIALENARSAALMNDNRFAGMSVKNIAKIIDTVSTAEETDAMFDALKTLGADKAGQVVDDVEKRIVRQIRRQVKGSKDLLKDFSKGDLAGMFDRAVDMGTGQAGIAEEQAIYQVCVRIAQFKGDAADPLTKLMAQERANFSDADYNSTSRMVRNMMTVYDTATAQKAAAKTGNTRRQPKQAM